eukprot:3039089-Pleurochrysis_carterae.AAC.1
MRTECPVLTGRNINAHRSSSRASSTAPCRQRAHADEVVAKLQCPQAKREGRGRRYKRKRHNMYRFKKTPDMYRFKKMHIMYRFKRMPDMYRFKKMHNMYRFRKMLDMYIFKRMNVADIMKKNQRR